MTTFDRIAQVKLPVTDLARSIAFYTRLLDLRLFSEFVEDGVLRGAGLIDAGESYSIALRDREVCANTPDLRGFDLLAFRPPSRAALAELIAHCARLGIEHREVVETPAGAILDVPDPDGTLVRFYCFEAPTSGFLGVESRDGAYVGSYAVPRSGPF